MSNSIPLDQDFDHMKFGAFIAPYHSVTENPTNAIQRDMKLVEHMDALGYDEAWIGEHHSAASEIIASPEVFIAAVAERTKRIRLGSGVSSLTYHHPLILADRFVQLDHQTFGRVMLGAGPGQLASDAAMMGIKPVDQRTMMVESLESILSLLNGETVSRKTSWFELDKARLQLLPYQRPRMDVAVAAVITPSGPSLAGRLGLSMLSLAASTPAGFDVLPEHWKIYEAEAQKANHRISRASWRIVVPMHIAPTRQQAMDDVADGTLDLVRYFGRLVGDAIPELSKIETPEAAARLWTEAGLPIGKLVAGSPDDAISYIRKLKEQTGGFGTFLILAHNTASYEATLRSYDLFSRFVIPQFQDSNRARDASLAWVEANSNKLIETVQEAQRKSIASYIDSDGLETKLNQTY